MSKEVLITFSQTVEEPVLTLTSRNGEETTYILSESSLSVFGEKLVTGSMETDGCSVSEVASLQIKVLSGEISTDMSAEDNSLSYDIHITAEKAEGVPIPRPISLLISAETEAGSTVEIQADDAEFSFKAVSSEAVQKQVPGIGPENSPAETAPVPTEVPAAEPTEAPTELPAETDSENEQQTEAVQSAAESTGMISLPGISNTSALLIGGGIGIAAALIVAAVIGLLRKKRRRAAERTSSMPVPESIPSTAAPKDSTAANTVPADIAVLCNIGCRPVQQDNFCVVNTEAGTLAVIADGMGGLQESDKVSALIVQCVKNIAGSVKKESTEGVLYPIIARINDQVCSSIGSDNLYKSGSTFVAVLAEEERFQWISVGDSRLYLYRAGGMIQLNREHIYFNDLLRSAVNRHISFKEALEDVHRNNLTSFIGMGNLSGIDGSIRSIAVCPGDILLLMTDGVFNSVSEESVCRLLSQGHGMEETARELEKLVLSFQNPKQDNFTAVLIHYE